MAGLADTIADNAVYVVLAVVLFALFFLALNGAMPDDAGPDDGANATTNGDDVDGDAADDRSGGAGNGTGTDSDDAGDGNATDAEGDGGGNASAEPAETDETTAIDVESVESAMIEGVDRVRMGSNASNASNASNVSGLSNITWVRSGALREMAAYHTEDMIDHGYVAVESPGGEGLDDRKQSFQPDCSGRPLAELVGRTDVVDETGARRNASFIARTVIDGWLDDRRDTLLGNETVLGAVAAGVDEEGDRVYVTMDLC
jgi:uncharacterized protein YkwD